MSMGLDETMAVFIADHTFSPASGAHKEKDDRLSGRLDRRLTGCFWGDLLAA
jgi:hypothetical protein